ncbi:BatD family protein [Shewanella cyperi]|uniref:BatD family protein n=1 Tax=Shewanella cyperi TaxID=2814292 RepID=UPI001A93BF78|nr:BatD family protein [Shewanella cyperi]QSX39583.1 protein BatD [Shewanella cyperi]
MVRIAFALLLTTLVTGPAWALSKLEATVDKNPVAQDEYLVLSISADDEIDAGKLDTSALLKDFIVGRTSISRSTQMLNFDTHRETRWQILLAAKQPGELTIPAFSLDGISSEPIKLTVLAADAEPVKMKNLYLETSLSTSEAYVGQLITYKVKLFLAQELQRGVLSAPVLEGAQIKQLGEDKDGTEIVDGRRLRVIERTYGIIADKAGEQALRGARFEGDVLVEAPRRGGMFSFNESRPIQAKAEDSSLKVLPLPAGFDPKGFVSDLALLKDNFTEEKQEFEVGAPISRTVTLVASNTDETSLPELELPLPASLKSYPEKPQRQTFMRNGRLVSQISLTQAIVPTAPGTYTLPKVEVPWWNPRLRRQELAVLPARTIEVTGAVPAPVAVAATTTPAVQTGGAAGYWPYLTGLFAIAWLLTLGLWWQNRKTTSEPELQQSTSEVLSTDLTGLRRACAGTDGGAMLNALCSYMAAEGYSGRLVDIAGLSPELAKAIAQIQQAAYARGAHGVNGDALLQAVLALPKAASARQAPALGPLNP